MKRTPYLLIAFIVLLVAACSPQEEATPVPTEEPAPETETVTFTISGSGSVTPILEAIADEFEAANPGYLLEVLPGSGTGGGVRGIIDGSLDVAAMSRPAKDSEAEQGVEYVQFGNSITTVYTHPDVGVTELTGDQLTGIFMGTITNWSEVGGPDLPIVVYVRDPEEGNTLEIRETYIGEDEFPETAQVMTSQTDMQNVVSTVEGAIGYGTWATAVAKGAAVVPVVVDGSTVDAPAETLVSEMGVGYLTDRAEAVKPFIDWLTSQEGQDALEAAGVIPLSSD